MGSVDHSDLLRRLRETTKRLDYSPDDWEDERQDVLAAIAAIESLTKRLAEQTEAKDAAIRLWNECGQSEIMLTAERDKYMALSKMRPAPIADLETLTAERDARVIELRAQENDSGRDREAS